MGRLAFFVLLLVFQTVLSYAEKPIVVLTTSYNNRNWIDPNLRSIFEQDYSNYRIIYVDDASEDGTADFVEAWVKNHPKKFQFDLIRNRERVGALANIYHMIHDRCSDEEIIVSLDGDDWFYDAWVLKRIDEIYSAQNVWLTHGTLLEFPGKTQGWSLSIPQHIIAQNAFRSYRCPSHLRTFYAWLFKRIRLEDLQHEGQFFWMTWDQAIMFPMIEMAAERHAFIPALTYVYNMSNPINDNKVNPQLQRDLEALIRAKPPYKRLNEEDVMK